MIPVYVDLGSSPEAMATLTFTQVASPSATANRQWDVRVSQFGKGQASA